MNLIDSQLPPEERGNKSIHNQPSGGMGRKARPTRELDQFFKPRCNLRPGSHEITK